MKRLVLVLFAGCRVPDPPGAIEITGYLDPELVRFAVVGAAVEAVGQPGAASAVAEVALENVATGDVGTATARDEGSFAVVVLAGDGDPLELRVVGAADDDTVHHETTTDRLAFPAVHDAHAEPDLHEEGFVLVTVLFDPPQAHLHVWVADDDSGGAAILASADGGITHTGTVPGAAGDHLVLVAVPDDGSPESLGYPLVVAP